jgi:uncharacterized protein YecE (DUF72 family)
MKKKPPPIHVGCAGWTIARSQADLFPGPGTHLQRFAQVLGVVEINSSFYRPHRPQTYVRWAAGVPQEFRFTVKLPKRITHELKLCNVTSEIEAFVGQIDGLGDRLNCILVQLPPSLRLDPDQAESFFSDVRGKYSGAVVCEPRHASWFTAESEALLQRHHVGRVAADPPPVPGAELPGGDSRLRYYRLHGSPRIYYSNYSAEFLNQLAERLLSEQRSGSEVVCIFDNTAEGHAQENALQLQSLLSPATRPAL